MRTKRHGVTLIELLVWIALICIVAAIFFPVIAGGRERSRASQCAASMKKIIQAAAFYASDYDGKLAPSPGDLAWIAHYLKPEDLKDLYCPSYSSGKSQESGYGFNLVFKSLPKKGQDKAYLWDGMDNTGAVPEGVFDEKLQVHIAPWVVHRHCYGASDNANVAFFDGHVKAFPVGTPEPKVFQP
jgi:prepilin-type processing-associated H-X9-DG protein/prepilin-type N-terminal cleavage/methylation domain-containing protein